MQNKKVVLPLPTLDWSTPEKNKYIFSYAYIFQNISSPSGQESLLSFTVSHDSTPIFFISQVLYQFLKQSTTKTRLSKK